MTQEEKVQFATGDQNWNYAFNAEGVERLGIPNIQMADGPAGVRIGVAVVKGVQSQGIQACGKHFAMNNQEFMRNGIMSDFGANHYDEGVFVGYRGFDKDGAEPAYPFGHGLSYTDFSFDDLTVTGGSGDVAATVELTVTNTGARAGSAVAQVYVGELPAPVETPPQQLAGWAKAHLGPGESQRVAVTVSRRSVSYFDVDAHDWTKPAGEVAIRVGASSRDIRATGTLLVS